MNWLLRFLFSHVIVSDLTFEVTLHGKAWESIKLVKLDGLSQVSILGIRVVHVHTSDGRYLHFRGDLKPIRESVQAELKRAVDVFAARTKSIIPDQYPTESVLTAAWSRCQQEMQEFIDLARSPFMKEQLGEPPELIELRDLWSALEGDPAKRKKYVERHIQNELVRYKDFFDRIESVPLTDEQRLACVVCEDRQLLIAAAGSGKSSTIVAKIGYLIQRGWLRPEQILALAFNKDAATELGERCQRRLSDLPDIDKIQAKTFHSFGYELIGKCRGKKPRLSPTASDDRSRLQLLRTLTQEAIATSQALAASYQVLQTYLLGADETLVEVMKTIQRDELTTLRGETVKSHQELLIANFLFIHRIPYEYERPYEHDVADPTHGQYQPDFYYPTIQTYHEHFAIDSKGEAPADFHGYMDKVEWRREAHKRYGTRFFETKSADFEDKTVFDKILYFLKSHGYDFQTMSVAAPALGEIEIKDRVSEVLDCFIANKKLTGISSEQLLEKVNDRSAWTKESLPLAEAVSSMYGQYLKNRTEIDFTDMLLEAAKAYKENPADLGIQYLLVDEFQDMSMARAELIHGVLRNNPGCKLFCVGDDWQSINGFSGSELRIMTQFREHFGPSIIQQLTKTFRSNQGISSVASSFVMENPAQLKKQIKALDPKSDGVIEVHLFHQPDEVRHIVTTALQKHLAKAPPGKKQNVFMLARYKAFLHRGAPSRFEASHLNLTEQIRKAAAGGEFDLKTTTFHGSKGLEADIVFLLGLVQEKLNPRCFPSRRQEEELVRLPLPDQEEFPDAEERRLMYVALTRARHKVIIPVPTSGMSDFAPELLKYSSHVHLFFQGQPAAPCPFCGEGVLLPGRKSPLECTNQHCFYSATKTKGKCPECGTGSLVIKPGQYGHFVGCDGYPNCRYIDRRDSQLLRTWHSLTKEIEPSETDRLDDQNREMISDILDHRQKPEAELMPRHSRKSRSDDNGVVDRRKGHVFAGGLLAGLDCPVKLD